MTYRAGFHARASGSVTHTRIVSHDRNSALYLPCHSDRQAVFRVFRLRMVKVSFEVMYHAVTRVAVAPQEVISNTASVQTLPNLFLAETLALIAREKRVDGAFLQVALDVFLNIVSRASGFPWLRRI